MSVVSGLWRCLVCAAGTDKGGGNVYTFMRLLLDESGRRTNGESDELAAERGLLYPETLTHWGAAVSILTGEWIVPGYSVDRKLTQLYRWGKCFRTGKRVLYSTADLPIQMYGTHLFDQLKPVAYVCEGPWDAMALWEMLRSTKVGSDGSLSQTGSEGSSLLAQANVLAVPGCGSFQAPWSKLLAGKQVRLMFDNDHPREHGGKVLRAGYDGMRRTANILGANGHPPKSVEFLRWGPDGHAVDLPSGFDVRDWLKQGDVTHAARSVKLRSLLGMVQPIPADWVPGRTSASTSSGNTELAPRPCESWDELLQHWMRAMRWRPVMSDVLATMLAVVASTKQSGVQLMLQVIGDAGSGKTRFCDALLVSRKCYSIEHLKGFFSGWKADQGEDFSLMARANDCTWITAEGDVLMSSPNFNEIMSQVRRAFDGSSSAGYKTLKADRKYDGLRIPWIIAGTQVLLDMNQARLGDRFLKVMFTSPDDDERRSIQMTTGFSALRAVRQSSNCVAGSIMEERMREAYCRTGGYVEHLRDNAEQLIAELNIEDEERLVAHCADLAEFTAMLRARPSPEVSMDKHVKESHDSKELPTRLTEQYVRLAVCAAVAMGRRSVDAPVLSLVQKVAVDTCRGRTMDLVRHLHRVGDTGMSLASLALSTGQTEAKDGAMLRFLRRIGAVELFSPTVKVGVRSNPRWRLTGKMNTLYSLVFSQ